MNLLRDLVGCIAFVVLAFVAGVGGLLLMGAIVAIPIAVVMWIVITTLQWTGVL